MGDKTYISSQVDEDSELYQRFEGYVDEKGHENKSAAVRELVHKQLEDESDPLADRPDTALAGLLWDARRDIHIFLLIAIVGYVGSLLTSGVVSTAFLVLSVAYASTVFLGAVDAVFFDRALTVWLLRRERRFDTDGVKA